MPKANSMPAEVIHRAQDSEAGFKAWLLQHAKNPQAVGLVAIHKTNDGDEQIAYWSIEDVRTRIDQMAQEVLGSLQSYTEDADTPCSFHVTFQRASESGAVLWMSRRFRLRPVRWDEKENFDGSMVSVIVQTQRHNEVITRALADFVNKTGNTQSAMLNTQTQMIHMIMNHVGGGEKGKIRLEEENARLREENLKLARSSRDDDDDDEALDIPAVVEQLQGLLQAAQGMTGRGGNGAG